MFPIVTLLFYIFLYPIGFILNVVGLVIGPERGCFVALLCTFVLAPVLLIAIVLGTGVSVGIGVVDKAIEYVSGSTDLPDGEQRIMEGNHVTEFQDKDTKGNEAGALERLSQLVAAEVAAHCDKRSYGSLETLTDSSPAYLEGDWSKAKDGYVFHVDAIGDRCIIRADPEIQGKTGITRFLKDMSEASSVVRFTKDGSLPTLQSPVILF